MAQKIVFKYADIESAAVSIDSIAGQYREKPRHLFLPQQMPQNLGRVIQKMPL